jgi:NAD(P)-dependent dehydrogenase (short-subunit alcohol dehydrogenase family)
LAELGITEEGGFQVGILDKLRLDGKVAVVTGAGRGLGRAMAVALARAGADVVCAARSQDQIEETARLVRELGPRSLALPTDVTDPHQCTNLIETTVKELGRIDILVNNAGGATPGYDKPVEEITDEEWRLGIDTNLSSVFYCCRAAIPHMVRQGGGKIINVSSGYGLRGGRNNFIYCSAKAAIINFTRSLALTYARYNIQANCIVPGFFPHENPEVLQYLRGGQFIPMGRVGRDEEIGPACVFLASSLSDHMNGGIIVLDGGGLAGGQAPTGLAPRIPLREE